MGSLSIWHWAIILVIVLVVFGGKFKVSDVMGDVAKGIKSFKKGMADDPVETVDSGKTLETPVAEAAKPAAKKVKS